MTGEQGNAPGGIPPGREIVGAKAENPLAPKAIEEIPDGFFSTADERAALAPELEALRRDGYVVLPQAIDADYAGEIASEIMRLNGETAWGRSPFDGYQTRRVYNLIAKTRVLDELCLHSQVLALIEGYLEDEVQISQTLGITLYPDQPAQALHRDDGYYPMPRPRLPLIMNAFWAITDFTAENGATHILPGTHITTDAEPPHEEPLRAEMPAGSVIVYDGSLFHGGGANQSSAPRIGLTMLYARAWLRQQENQYLAVPREIIRGMSRRQQKLMGYWVMGNILGWVEGRSPLHAIAEDS